MQIGETTRKMPTVDLEAADVANAATFRHMNSGPPWPQALLEVFLCSGAPTQFLVAGLLALAGLSAGTGDQITLPLVVYLASLDTVLLIGLVFGLLVLGGESPRQVLLGARPIGGEVLRGIGLLPWVFLLLAVTGLVLVRFAPGLFTPNPFEKLATTRNELILFGAVTIVAGGVREEIQRAFILHRCEQRLGGAIVGVIGYGLLFGVLHFVQGIPAMIITGLLGTLWSLVYLARRSIVAPVVSHAGFNLIEVIGFGLLT
jgi:membrane protease YdiL (CAAX protease family)